MVIPLRMFSSFMGKTIGFPVTKQKCMAHDSDALTAYTIRKCFLKIFVLFLSACRANEITYGGMY